MNAALAIAVTAAIAAGCAAIVYSQLRHAALTAMLLIAPLPAVVAAWLWAHRYTLADASYVLALVCLLPVAARYVRLICEGRLPRKAFPAALGETGAFGFAAVAAFALPLAALFWRADMRMAEICAGFFAVALGCLATALAILGLSVFLPYTEEFVARANRARERREVAAGRLDAIAQTRWGLSFAGIALVLAALAGFALRGAAIGPGAAIYLPLAAASAFAVFLGAARDWRLAVAMTLALALVAGFALAAEIRAGLRLGAFDLAILGMACATGAVPLCVLGAAWGRSLRQGDQPAAALLRALREDGPAAFAAALLAAVPALFVLFATLPKPLPTAVAGLGFLFAVFPVFPALGIAIHALLPRYRSADEVFGRR